LLLSTEPHLETKQNKTKQTNKQTKNSERSRLKRTISTGFPPAFSCFIPLFFSCLVLFPTTLFWRKERGRWTGCLVTIVHINLSIFSVNSSQNFCVATGRMWFPFRFTGGKSALGSGPC
jgi:hypothetical protein